MLHPRHVSRDKGQNMSRERHLIALAVSLLVDARPHVPAALKARIDAALLTGEDTEPRLLRLCTMDEIDCGIAQERWLQELIDRHALTEKTASVEYGGGSDVKVLKVWERDSGRIIGLSTIVRDVRNFSVLTAVDLFELPMTDNEIASIPGGLA